MTFCLFNLKNFRRRKKANFSQKWPEDFEHHYEGWKEIDEYYVISKILKNLSGKFWEMIQKIYCSFILINTCSFDENTTSMDSSPITLQGYHRKTQKSRFQLKIYRIISLMHTSSERHQNSYITSTDHQIYYSIFFQLSAFIYIEKK